MHLFSPRNLGKGRFAQRTVLCSFCLSKLCNARNVEFVAAIFQCDRLRFVILVHFLHADSANVCAFRDRRKRGWFSSFGRDAKLLVTAFPVGRLAGFAAVKCGFASTTALIGPWLAAVCALGFNLLTGAAAHGAEGDLD